MSKWFFAFVLMLGLAGVPGMADEAPVAPPPTVVAVATPVPVQATGPVTLTGPLNVTVTMPQASVEPRRGSPDLTAPLGCGHPAVSCERFVGYRVVVPGGPDRYVVSAEDANNTAAAAIAALAATVREEDLARRLREAEAALATVRREKAAAEARLSNVERAARGEPVPTTGNGAFVRR